MDARKFQKMISHITQLSYRYLPLLVLKEIPCVNDVFAQHETTIFLYQHITSNDYFFPLNMLYCDYMMLALREPRLHRCVSSCLHDLFQKNATFNNMHRFTLFTSMNYLNMWLPEPESVKYDRLMFILRCLKFQMRNVGFWIGEWVEMDIFFLVLVIN